MHDYPIAATRPSRERSERLIRLFASKAARLLVSDASPDDVSRAVDQTRRRLSVRIHADVNALDFWNLADSIAEARGIGAADWADLFDTADEKDIQLGRLNETITAEIQAIAHTFAFRDAA